MSQSDPDETLVSRKSTYRKMAYKAHYAVDSDSRIITDCYGTTGSRHECIVMSDRITFQIDRFGPPTQEVMADKGYGRVPTFQQFRGLGIRIYSPPHDDNIDVGRISRGAFA